MRPELVTDDNLPLHPLDEALLQGEQVNKALARTSAEFLHFPWPSLDMVIGGIAPGEVWFVGAYSGHGKTTFMMSALNLWFEQGKSLFYLGLESQPSVLRTQWACQRLGLSAGEVLSGKMGATHADWPFTRKKIIEEIHWQTLDDRSSRVYFSPEKFVDAYKLQMAVEQAADLGSDVLMIDHVDHLEGSKGGLYANSVQSMKVLLNLAQKFGVKVLAATQFNNEMIRGNRLGMHLPPTPTAVYQGGHKRQIASGMIGLYKPLRPDITKSEIQRFSRGELEPQDVVERGVMAALVMKHRLFGEREGKRAMLRVQNGKVLDRYEP